MLPTRREMLAACAAAIPALASAADRKPAASDRKRLGVVIHSYGIRGGGDRNRPAAERFSDALNFIEYCRKLGAGGVQVPIGVRDQAGISRLRTAAEAGSMYLEGSIRLPQDKADVDRFTAEVRTARDCGATVLRSAILSGRRYEIFDTAAAYRQFADRSYQSMGLAEPVVAKHGLRLAIENHKDWRADELIDMLKRLGSKQVGVCVDTGNSIALLEDPMEVVEAYAPYAYAVHLKDMGVQEYSDGFLLSEVPFGKGYLDLRKMVQVLRKANPKIQFSLEMITRDPLRVPCLTPKYWATFESLAGKHLARSLNMVRKHASKDALPRISELSQEKKLDAEDRNVRQCLAHAQEHLHL